jgi:hypothetical protein
MTVMVNELEVVPAETGTVPAAPVPEGGRGQASAARTARQVEQAIRVRRARAERLRAY